MGHFATRVNDTVYSFGQSGMTIISFDEYIERNSFRWTVGYNLNLTDSEALYVELFLTTYDKSYSYINRCVCTTPIRESLNSIGLLGNLSRYNSLFPSELKGQLDDILKPSVNSTELGIH